MNVLLVHNRYRSASPSGEDRVVEQESAALKSVGHRVEHFERSSDDIAEWPMARKVALPGQVLWSDEARRSLIGMMRKFEPEVVHLHNVFPLISPSVLYGCRSERVPVVVTLHNYRLVCPTGELFRDGAGCHDCLGRRLPLPALRHGCYKGSTLATLPLAAGLVAHRRAWRTMVSAYIFLAEAQRRIIAENKFPEDRCFVKQNFVPLAVMPHRGPDEMVVYAGRLASNKGVPLLMEAWDRYTKDAGDSSLRLVVAGAGPMEGRVREWAESRGSVEWRGMLSRSEARLLLGKARAAIVPSQWEEPFGLVAVEAMAAGVPAVAPAHGSFPELIVHGQDGVLFRPGDPSSLAAAFHHVAADPEWFEALGRQARCSYERRFSPEVNVQQLLEIYRFAVENPAHARSG